MVTIKRYDVVADDLNPRTISDDNKKRLRKSIEKNGLVGHPVWNKTTGHIVGCHQRPDAKFCRTEAYVREKLVIPVLRDWLGYGVARNMEFERFINGEKSERPDIVVVKGKNLQKKSKKA